MVNYVIKRSVYGLIVLLIMISFVFIVMRLVPGDVVALQLSGAGAVSEEQIAQLRSELGLDKSVWAQFLDWTKNAVTGDLGKSLWSKMPVTTLIAERITVTLQLAFMAITMAILIAIPAGIYSAMKRNTWIDHMIRVIAIGGLSIPNFWFALLLIIFLSLFFGWIPPLGYQSFFSNPIVNLQQMILPALVLALSLSASIVRMTRSSLLEVLHADFIRTIRAKGAKEKLVIMKHALRNSLIPVITLIGLQVGFLLGGTVIIESIFSLPGIGSLIFEGVTKRDYPVVQATVLVYGALFMIVNLIVDIAYGWIDPRMRPD
ncbi:nickel ABC transporter permease [Peribacillus glennii]|uniref:Nickel import system permease protein NikB n=1 Tax=Peribacillus glennii TaxID=2303991 RepID=A0A372LG37_9BACI|nr:nickel ABC transporter permease [Peribacillus glennii]RFU65265.1 ABC transporter permease [Peribacillus glennii]